MESLETGYTPSSLQPFVLAGIRVDPGLNEVTRGHNSVRIEPRVMQLLLFLAEQAGQTCTREDIMAAVWPDSLPNEEALTQSISKLRKALGDGDRTLLETIRKVGYRLNGQLSRIAPSSSRLKDRSALAVRAPKTPSSKRWMLSMAAMLLVAFGISRFKVIAIHHDGFEGPHMVKIQTSQDDGPVRTRLVKVGDGETLADVLKWVESEDLAAATVID